MHNAGSKSVLPSIKRCTTFLAQLCPVCKNIFVSGESDLVILLLTTNGSAIDNDEGRECERIFDVSSHALKYR